MSRKGPSISDLLQESLNVMADEIGGDGASASPSKAGMTGPSASSLLINMYKDKISAKDDVIKVKAVATKAPNAFLSQLSSSIDTSGTEWKGMFGKAKAKSDNTQVVNPPHHKEKQKNKERGQNYKDRFN
jgi:hypothetical protein